MASHHDGDECSRDLFDWLTTIFLEGYSIVLGATIEYDAEGVMRIFFGGGGFRDEVAKPGRREVGGFEIEVDDLNGYSFDIFELRY